MSASTFFKPENDSVLVLKKKSRALSLGSFGGYATMPTLLYIPSEKLAISLDADDQLIRAWEAEEIPVADESLAVYNEKFQQYLAQQKEVGNKYPYVRIPLHSELLTPEEFMLGYEKIYLSAERVSAMVYAATSGMVCNR